jgi:acyl-coenzyme A thioesterase PaaI-like protein
VVFGGYIASLIDQQAALALMSVIPDGTIQLTRRLEVEFLAPLAPDRVLRVEAEGDRAHRAPGCLPGRC